MLSYTIQVLAVPAPAATFLSPACLSPAPTVTTGGPGGGAFYSCMNWSIVNNHYLRGRCRNNAGAYGNVEMDLNLCLGDDASGQIQYWNM